MILNPFFSCRVSEIELVRKIGDPLHEFFERNVFLVWGEVANAQTPIDLRFVYGAVDSRPHSLDNTKRSLGVPENKSGSYNRTPVMPDENLWEIMPQQFPLMIGR